VKLSASEHFIVDRTFVNQSDAAQLVVKRSLIELGTFISQGQLSVLAQTFVAPLTP
jgi:hypothetical protein